MSNFIENCIFNTVFSLLRGELVRRARIVTLLKRLFGAEMRMAIQFVMPAVFTTNFTG